MDDPQPVDSHAHVWDRACSFVPGARYHPDYGATIDNYLRLLDAHGIEKAVLVQPSFLGTDNGYLVSCLEAYPGRLRGIVVVPATISGDEMDDMTAAGVIGHRFNLVGHDPESIAAPSEISLIERMATRGWWAEVQVDGAHWPMVLDVLAGTGVRVMVDHFGKPAGPDCPGHHALLAIEPGRHCVKLSAPYRQKAGNMAPFASAFLEAWGPERCLWGSDWPWTQHEGRHSYADATRWLDDWTTPDQRAAMREAAPRLLGF